MVKVPFTPEGVLAKTEELYALSDQELLVQAQAVGTDFKSWFRTHFILKPSQEEYLGAIPASFLLFWGYQFGSAFIGRLPVMLMGLPDEPRRTKQGNTSASFSGSYTPERNGNAPELSFDGEVTIEFIEE